MNPQKLIKAVLAAYESFDSYSDAGICTTGFDDARVEFETRFKRPNNFLFEWATFSAEEKKTPEKSSIWSNEEVVIVRAPDSVEEEFEDFVKASVSDRFLNQRRSAELVLDALVPKQKKGGKAWYEITKAFSMPDEIINDASCFHIVGSRRNPDDIEVWIEQSTFHIRRIVSKVIITEDDCQKMNSDIGNARGRKLVKGMKKAGQTKKEIESSMSLLQAAFYPGTDVYTYDYNEVHTNEVISSDYFKKP